MDCEQIQHEQTERERLEAATAAVRARLDVSQYWEGIEYKRWVVAVEAGPYKRKKPAFSTTIHVRARTRDEAVTVARQQLWQKVRRPTFSARLAHPVKDLGMTPAPADFAPEGPAAPLSAQMQDSYGQWCIVCKCGHKADVDDFCRTPRGAELPRAEYQCPKCFRAWAIKTVREGWQSPDGQYLPAQLACVAILPRL